MQLMFAQAVVPPLLVLVDHATLLTSAVLGAVLKLSLLKIVFFLTPPPLSPYS